MMESYGISKKILIGLKLENIEILRRNEIGWAAEKRNFENSVRFQSKLSENPVEIEPKMCQK